MTHDIVPLAALERAALVDALDKLRRRDQVAIALGVSLKTLYNMIHRHGLTHYLAPPRGRRSSEVVPR